MRVDGAVDLAELAAAPGRTIPSGTAALFTIDGSELYLKDDSQVVRSLRGVYKSINELTPPAPVAIGDIAYGVGSNALYFSANGSSWTRIGAYFQSSNARTDFAFPVTGQVIFETGTGELLRYSGSAWQSIAGTDYKDLPTEYSSTTPASPSSGVRVFTRNRARRTLAFVDATGFDTQVQPSFATNQMTMMRVASGSTSAHTYGITPTIVAAATAPAIGVTNYRNRLLRLNYATTTTAGTAGGFRGPSQIYYLSSTANVGGFHFVCRFAPATTGSVTRIFVGMLSSAAAYSAAVDPSSLTNQIGIGCDLADTNLYFMRNDASGVATKVDTGFSKTDTTTFYEFGMYAPPGGGLSVRMYIRRLSDGAFFDNGGANYTTDIPAVDVGINPYFHISNGTSATSHSLDFQQLYIETDN